MQAKEEKEESRIGIYVCHCGLNIAGVVDCAAVAEYGKGLRDVIVSRHDTYLCSEPGQNQIKDDIREQRSEPHRRRVLLAAAPRADLPEMPS